MEGGGNQEIKERLAGNNNKSATTSNTVHAFVFKRNTLFRTLCGVKISKYYNETFI